MKAMPNNYLLKLSQVDKEVLKRGIHAMIDKGDLSPVLPELMARALKILAVAEGNMEDSVIVTSSDARYILIPALQKVPVCMIEPGMFECLYNIKDGKS